MGREPYMRRSGADYRNHATNEIVKPYAFMHPCCVEGCEAWGSYGFGCDLRRGKPGKWYCREHLPTDSRP